VNENVFLNSDKYRDQYLSDLCFISRIFINYYMADLTPKPQRAP